jgi:hypothetical protein
MSNEDQSFVLWGFDFPNPFIDVNKTKAAHVPRGSAPSAQPPNLFDLLCSNGLFGPQTNLATVKSVKPGSKNIVHDQVPAKDKPVKPRQEPQDSIFSKDLKDDAKFFLIFTSKNLSDKKSWKTLDYLESNLDRYEEIIIKYRKNSSDEFKNCLRESIKTSDSYQDRLYVADALVQFDRLKRKPNLIQDIRDKLQNTEPSSRRITHTNQQVNPREYSSRTPSANPARRPTNTSSKTDNRLVSDGLERDAEFFLKYTTSFQKDKKRTSEWEKLKKNFHKYKKIIENYKENKEFIKCLETLSKQNNINNASVSYEFRNLSLNFPNSMEHIEKKINYYIAASKETKNGPMRNPPPAQNTTTQKALSPMEQHVQHRESISSDCRRGVNSLMDLEPHQRKRMYENRAKHNIDLTRQRQTYFSDEPQSVGGKTYYPGGNGNGTLYKNQFSADFATIGSDARHSFSEARKTLGNWSSYFTQHTRDKFFQRAGPPTVSEKTLRLLGQGGGRKGGR